MSADPAVLDWCSSKSYGLTKVWKSAEEGRGGTGQRAERSVSRNINVFAFTNSLNDHGKEHRMYLKL